MIPIGIIKAIYYVRYDLEKLLTMGGGWFMAKQPCGKMAATIFCHNLFPKKRQIMAAVARMRYTCTYGPKVTHVLPIHTYYLWYFPG